MLTAAFCVTMEWLIARKTHCYCFALVALRAQYIAIYSVTISSHRTFQLLLGPLPAPINGV